MSTVGGGGGSRRVWAVAALAALALLICGLVAAVVASRRVLVPLVAVTLLSLAVVAATGWWAFTTRRVWKRRLNLAIAGLVAADALLGLLLLGLGQALEALVVAAGALGYAAAARRALRPARPPAGLWTAAGSADPGPPRSPAPARAWLLVNPRSGGGKAERLDLAGALDAFDGLERRIDVGLVGERVFLNNVSLGAYADMVAEPGYRAAKLVTAHAVLPGALRGERPRLQVDLHDDRGRPIPDVLVLLVANNRYEAGGSRGRLDGGVLQVTALRARTGAALAGVAARLVAGRRSRTRRWAQWTTTALRVEASLPQLPAGIDGEAVTLTPPLEFRVLPRALRVLLPPALGPQAQRLRLYSPATARRLLAIAAGRG